MIFLKLTARCCLIKFQKIKKYVGGIAVKVAETICTGCTCTFTKRDFLKKEKIFIALPYGMTGHDCRESPLVVHTSRCIMTKITRTCEPALSSKSFANEKDLI